MWANDKKPKWGAGYPSIGFSLNVMKIFIKKSYLENS